MVTAEGMYLTGPDHSAGKSRYNSGFLVDFKLAACHICEVERDNAAQNIYSEEKYPFNMVICDSSYLLFANSAGRNHC